MKFVLIVLFGLFSGYIMNNIKEKEIEEIFEDLIKKADYWNEAIQEFFGKTLSEIEGFDSETIKINLEIFIEKITESIEELLRIEDFDEKIKYLELKLTEISSSLVKKIEKLEGLKAK
ncbi:MAG: hypothetical protein TYPL_2940 [Candidatus Tyloplasma litorale]|nr:MAG: hypothetical protein TYPL_2940 [Mycoplasmatales bacterium]